MRHALSCLGLLVALELPVVASATTIALLDAMTDPFPPSPCLTSSGQPVIFTGTYCDGVTCPPDPIVPDCGGAGFVEQVGLPGVLGGVTRTAQLAVPDLNDVSSARVVQAPAHLEVSVAGPTGLDQIWLTYSDDVQDWNLDLVTQGITHIGIPIEGILTPSHPLVCRVVMSDFGGGASAGGSAEIDVHLMAPGTLVIPFSSFTTHYDFDLNAVDAISIAVSECGAGTCSVDPLPPRSFSLGPIELISAGPTVAQRTSWGDLKVRYR